jgi:hypothetical protein
MPVFIVRNWATRMLYESSDRDYLFRRCRRMNTNKQALSLKIIVYLCLSDFSVLNDKPSSKTQALIAVLVSLID